MTAPERDVPPRSLLAPLESRTPTPPRSISRLDACRSIFMANLVLPAGYLLPTGRGARACAGDVERIGDL